MKNIAKIVMIMTLVLPLPLFADGHVADFSDAMSGTVELTVENKGLAFVTETIIVKKGTTVELTFVNTGGFHDWVLDEFDAATSQIRAGQSETIEFVADMAGEFEFYCSVGNHRRAGM
ncbi:MAG: cupredoxin domain-containing protein, partial [Desulfobacterales bacterium]|nr:cupredoxin domain-containing protein [Desulfobacterales bacterium]